MKVYKIEIMGSDTPTYADSEDVAKIVKATNSGAKLVLVRNAFINPSSIKRISRAYNTEQTLLESRDEELEAGITGKLLN